MTGLCWVLFWVDWACAWRVVMLKFGFGSSLLQAWGSFGEPSDRDWPLPQRRFLSLIVLLELGISCMLVT